MNQKFGKVGFCVIAGVLILVIIMIALFALSDTESPTASGLIGIILGAFIGLLGSFVNAVSGVFAKSLEKEEHLKDRAAKDALELTRMDYEMRQKAIDFTKQPDLFLAPAKVYRTLYRALMDLHLKNEWPSTVEEQGLLRIFPLGPSWEKKNK